jgi:hypothetical protein
MKTRLFLGGVFVVTGLLAGCQSLPPGAEPGPHGTMAYLVSIEASEPGVRIEANNQSIGTAPVTLKIFGDPDGTFHDFGAYEYIIQAFPVKTNQFVQTRVFRTGKMFEPEDRIPRQIYFDMNQPPPAYPPPSYYPPPAYYSPPLYYGPSIYFGPSFYHRPYYHHYRHHGHW